MQRVVSDLLEERLRAVVDPECWVAAEDLLAEHAVLDVHREGRTVEVRLANDEGSFERVELIVGKRRVLPRCTCSRPGQFCSHVAAAILAAGERSVDLADELADALRPADAAGAEHPLDPSQDPLGSGPEPPSPPSAELADAVRDLVRDTPFRGELRLKIGGGLPAMESRWRHVPVDIELGFKGRPYASGNLRRLVESGSASGGMQLRDFTPQEQQIMRCLCGCGEAVGGRFELSAYAMSELLHCLVGFSNVWAGKHRLHVHGTPLKLVFAVTGNQMTPRFVLPGKGALPTDGTSYVVGTNGYWVALGEHYWWLPGVLPPQWFRHVLSGGSTAVTDRELDRLRTRCGTGRFEAALVEGESMPEVVVRHVPCQPELTIDWSTTALEGVLRFRYGSSTVSTRDPALLWTANELVARDDATEAEARAKLGKAGFRFREDGTFYLDQGQAKAVLRFMQDVLPTLSNAWHVHESKAFAAAKRNSGAASLAIVSSGEDGASVDLKCSVRGPRGRKLDLEELLARALAGYDTLCLDEGGVVSFEEGIREILRALAQRASDRDDDVFHLDRFVAPALEPRLIPYWDGEQAGWQQSVRRLLQYGKEDSETSSLPLPESLASQLRGYQAEGVRWLLTLGECGFHGVLADEMGLGKTIQALATLVARKRTGQAGGLPSLVICPTSLVANWSLEAARFAPELRCVAIHGPERQELVANIANYDLAITSYALLRRDSTDYAETAFDSLILDEAQHIKNPGTANARACKSLRARHRLVLTGTPVENSLAEVWSLFDFLLPGFLGTQREFRDEYDAGDDEDSDAGTRALALKIRPFILRRTKADVCSQLPPKTEQVIYFDLGPGQRQLHDRLLAAGVTVLREARERGWQTRRFEVLSVLLRLRQVCCHPCLLPANLQGDDLEGVESAKTDLATEIILESLDSGHRVLLFSQFTSLLAVLRSWLDERGISYEYLDGSTKDRQERVDRFNGDPSIGVFLLSLRAGGTGLNLTGADTVIHYDQWWNPMVEDQATDRTHRIGQERPVTAFKLVARDTVEERVLALQENKRELFRQLLDGVPSGAGELDIEDLAFLLGDSDSRTTASSSSSPEHP